MAEDEGEGENRGFRVSDRRRFDEQGEARPADREAPAPASAATSAAAGAVPMDFTTFLVSLSSSAFYYLGEVPHPNSGRVERDLALAKQTIDILGILEEKTRGNLTAEENQVLAGLLYDLRLRYVQELRGQGPTGEAQGTRDSTG